MPWATERAAPGELVVDVDRVEIAGKTGEVDDIGLGDRASWAFPLVADDQVIKTEDIK